MSLDLSKEQIIERLKSKKINLNFNLQLLINNIQKINYKILNFLRNNHVTGYERATTDTNPLLWEIGHFGYFYEYHYFKYIIPNYKFVLKHPDIYDSFITDKNSRFKFKENSKDYMFKYLNYIFSMLKTHFNNNNIHNKYLLILTLLHNHMHCESIIYTKKMLGYSNCFNLPTQYSNSKSNYQFKFIKIKGNMFKQGTIEGENLISFDNELPQFEKYVDDFFVSETCFTEKLLLNFILDNGYNNKHLWSKNGWKWKLTNNISLPLYWHVDENNDYLIKDHDRLRDLINNNPACHISYYEAEAICKWMGGRLPTESEWEYLATNGGNTKFPWGNEWIEGVANLDYSGNILPVDIFQKGQNKNGIKQLFGNVWEWCHESFYPYDGFKIDPVYREFSYPFFGFKKILRGGSWAVPKILINSRYRNAQLPHTRIQFTGVRIVKDIEK